MPTQLQFRRGTTSQNNSFTGAVGELSIDTDTENIRIHDGSSAGGVEIMPAGTIVAFGNTTAPTGWLACNDAAVGDGTQAQFAPASRCCIFSSNIFFFLSSITLFSSIKHLANSVLIGILSILGILFSLIVLLLFKIF